MKYKTDNLIFKNGAASFYRDGKYIIQAFSGAPYSRALAEAYAHTFAYEAGLPVPRTVDVFNADDCCAIVYECGECRPLSDLVADSWSEELLDSFTRLQVSVHGRKAPRMHKLRERMHEKLGASPVDPTRRYELHNELDSLPKHNKLCHGSFLPENILVTEDGRFLIVGWSHATQGNASADASYTYLNLLLRFGAVTAESYLSLFCTVSDIGHEYVERWLPIVAATMLAGRDSQDREILNQFITKPRKRAKNV
ncbi:MAG: phosphotransferase [Clostridia bacterium]|nr:phosphotransferase [Clostridia bacterium]